MTAHGAHFEIKVDGVVRTHRNFRESAIEADGFCSSDSPVLEDRRHRPARRLECLVLTGGSW
jgi:hypothetical protein